MNAIVLAAGFATRLYPLTRDRAKQLLDVAGRPVLSHLLDRVQEIEGLRGVAVVSNHRFYKQFVAWRDEYACRVPVELVDDGATRDDQRLGAIADLRLAADTLANRQAGGDDDLLVLAGDNLIEFSLVPYWRAFAGHRQPTLLCRRLRQVPPGRHGEVCTDGAGRITGFREKPPDPRSDLVATCFYLLPGEVRDDLTAYLAGGGERDAPGHFIGWLAGRRTVRAVAVTGRFYDIGNRESLERARAEFRGARG